MANQNFLTAVQGLGNYCPVKNELRIRKGGKIFRFTCGECELRFAAPGQPEVVILFAADAKVEEFRQYLTSLIGKRKQPVNRRECR